MCIRDSFTTVDTEGSLRERIANRWGWHEEVGQHAQLLGVLEQFGFDMQKVWLLDSSTGSYSFNATWYSAWAVATRDPISWDEGAESPLMAPKREELYSWFWTYKWAHSVPVYLNIVTGPGYTWDLLQAEGVTWADLNAGGVTWEDLADAESELLRLSHTWISLQAEGVTWADLNEDGVTWRRGMTAR